MTDPASLERAVAGRDVVFHLAGIRRAATRDEFMRVNAEGTRNVCEALRPRRRQGAPGALRLAGRLRAPRPLTRPHVEEDPFHPTEWYGESKAEAERITLSYADRLPVTVIRPPRILGPGDHENLTFFKLVKRASAWRSAAAPGLSPLVDVEDVVDLLLLLAEPPRGPGRGLLRGWRPRTSPSSSCRTWAPRSWE